MSVIDEIKDRLDIVEIIGSHVQLKQAGRIYKGLCPFHQEKTPSFVVYPDTQTCWCFGCNEGGDVINFVMKLEGLDFPTALRELARQAGVELKQSQEEKRAAAERRAREDVYKAAVGHFQALLKRNQVALDYIAGRGLSEAIDPALIGFYDGNRVTLAKALQQAGIDVKSPAAQAVLRMPPGMLTIPHLQRGRIGYISARSIEGKKHWNMPEELAGERPLYFNHVYRPNAGQVMVIEGQADALTLGVWGIPAIALCGGGNHKALIKALEGHKRAWLGLDTDQAGADLAAKLAKELYPLTQIITWPEDAKDANDWMQAGATADDLNKLMKEAPCYLYDLVDSAIPNDGQNHDEDALRAVFLAVIKLTPFDLGRMRASIAAQLGISLETFDVLLKSTRHEVGLDEHGRPQYEIIAGRMCHRHYDRYGNGSLTPMCNFSAWIASDVLSDDGEMQERSFTIEGKLPDGTPLPRIDIDAGEFPQMSWVLPAWGARAVIMAGNSNKDHLRAAIQTLSKEIETIHEYAHLGWREIKGEKRYLSAAGAVGADGVRVKLPPDLQSYKLPVQLNGQQKDAMIASLGFMDTGSLYMTLALWAAIYLAPLSTILNPAFTIWLFGTTGSLKSTAAALALMHFGRFAYNTPPASWTGTINALEKKAFLVKDCLLWIDDYTTQATDRGMNEIQAKADQLLRDWGNRAGKSRMRSDLKLRITYAPRGLIISTAEILPPGPSIAPRLFAIEARPDMMTCGEGSPLTEAQLHHSQLYQHAMAGYVDWLAPQLDTLEETILEIWLQYKEAATREGHARIPGNVAAMYIGYEMGLKYALEIGAITAGEFQQRLETGWQILNELGAMQHKDVTEKSPIELYINALEQMFATGKIFLRHKDDEIDTRAWPATRIPTAEHIGWYDDQFWYLLPDVTFGAVFRFYKAAGVVFPDNERGMRAKLLEGGLLKPGDQLTYKFKSNGPRTLRIFRPDITGLLSTQEPGIEGTVGILGANENGNNNNS